MLIGGAKTIADIPAPSFSSGGDFLQGALSPIKSVGSRLVWSTGLQPARPALRTIDVIEPEHYDTTRCVTDEALGRIDPTHFLNYQNYLSRRFVVCEGRDILSSRHSKVITAPGIGVIDEFNVGGASGLPSSLISMDFESSDFGWDTGNRRIERISGLSIPLCHFGIATFGHFILDGLLQVFVFRKALDHGDARLLHWPLAHAWMEPLLETVGVRGSARRLATGDAVLMQKAGLSSALAGHGVYFPNSLSVAFFAWLREIFGLENVKGADRLYIRRPDRYARHISNASALEALAQARGFEIMCPETTPVADQMRAFAAARVAMSAWGSSLALAPLMAADRCVIEILPSAVTDAWFVRQAFVHGLDYRPLLHASTSDGDIEANLERIDQALCALPT